MDAKLYTFKKWANQFTPRNTNKFFCYLLLLVCCSFATSTQAQTADIAQEQNDPATISVYNRDVYTLRADFLGNGPQERARIAEERISALIKQHDNPKASSTSNEIGSIIQINNKLGFVIVNNDVDKLNGETLEAATTKTINQLNQIIAANAESHNSERLLKSIRNTAIATALMLGLFWLLNRIKRFFDWRILSLANKNKIPILNAKFFTRERLVRVLRNITRSVYWFFALLLSYEWLSYTLEQFPYTRPWGKQLNAFLIELIQSIGLAIIDYLPHMATALAIVFIARLIISFSNGYFDRLQQGETISHYVAADLADPSRKIINIVIWIFALVMVYPYLPGSGSEAFKGISVLIGLMISLGASNIISQAASGMIITFTRILRVGEYVRIGDTEGTVTQSGTFTTRIRTGMGEEITLSNSMVFSNVTKNYSRAVPGSGYILDTTVTIGYDTPWRQVEAMLLEAASEVVGISKDHAPKVFQTSLSDFYPEYRLVCYASPEKPLPRAEALSALHANIQDVFNKYGVQIMSPHYMRDPLHEKIVSADRKYLSPAKPPE